MTRDVEKRRSEIWSLPLIGDQVKEWVQNRKSIRCWSSMEILDGRCGCASLSFRSADDPDAKRRKFRDTGPTLCSPLAKPGAVERGPLKAADPNR